MENSAKYLRELPKEEQILVSRELVKNTLNSLDESSKLLWSDGDPEEPSEHRWFINDKEYSPSNDMYSEEELIHLLNAYVNGENLKVEVIFSEDCF